MVEPIVSNDGIALFQREWAPAASSRDAPGVLLIHGLGEHCGRYDALAQWFVAAGWRVRGYDHRGHGRSDGRRGGLAAGSDLTADAAAVLRAFNTTLAAPAFVLGHSMGGLVAAHLAASTKLPVGGLILSSPALDIGLSKFQTAQLALMRRVLPDLPLPNGLQLQYLSRDPAVVAAYRADPLVHDRITARLVGYMLAAAAEVQASAAHWPTRTLLLVAGSDRLVRPEGSRRFAAAAPVDRLSMRWYDQSYHELFNEPDRGQVLADLAGWLAAGAHGFESAPAVSGVAS